MIRREAKAEDLGGNENRLSTFACYNIRQSSIYKGFALENKESSFRGIIKSNNRSLRRASADPQCPFRSLSQSTDLATPRAPTQAGFKAAQHWNLAQRPFYRSPIGPALASCHQLEPHPAQGENSDKAELRHITPVRAYISLTLLVFSSLSGHSPNVTLSSRATPRQAYGFS
jgi:hypothetical protein